MEKKYELTNETIEFGGKILHRIKALKDFNDVKKGDLGGYIEKEENLSHEGNAWVSDNAWVCGNAWVSDNAKVFGNAWVYGNAKVFGNAEVFGNAWVFGNAKVFGNAWVFGNAKVYDDAKVYDNARIYDDADISNESDYCYIGNFGSKGRTSTFYKCKDNIIRVNCGCFNGTLDEFRTKVKETHGDSKYAKEYLLLADLMELRLSE